MRKGGDKLIYNNKFYPTPDFQFRFTWKTNSLNKNSLLGNSEETSKTKITEKCQLSFL